MNIRQLNGCQIILWTLPRNEIRHLTSWLIIVYYCCRGRFADALVESPPYCIKTKKETKKNSFKGSLEKGPVTFRRTSGLFLKLCGYL